MSEKSTSCQGAWNRNLIVNLSCLLALLLASIICLWSLQELEVVRPLEEVAAERGNDARKMVDMFSPLNLSSLQVVGSEGDVAPREAEECQIQLVESIPEGLVFNSTTSSLSTYQTWVDLIERANTSLEFASSYWSLRGVDTYQHPSNWQGEDIFFRIREAAVKRGIHVRIAQNLPTSSQPSLDTILLGNLPGISVTSLNFTHLMGAGILHTKLWLVDRKHFYVGSANFDWRSLTQVKEMGVVVKNCPTLAQDMAKIFDVYWLLGGKNKSVPPKWPQTLSTNINNLNPMMINNTANASSKGENEILTAYLTSSPPPFCPDGRVSDIEAILNVISSAQEFIHVAVMDYFPITIYSERPMFWPVIDDALRKAAIERGVKVKLLFSMWIHSRPSIRNYLKSLTDLSHGTEIDIQGKLFKVPSFTPDQTLIPYARVNHNKYMVTERTAVVGTSNWSADYFINTGGIGFIFSSLKKQNNGYNLYQQICDVFMRDFSSSYAHQP